MEFFSTNSYTPGSAGCTSLDRVLAADTPSPLLLKRLQQQKKKLADAKAEAKKSTLGALEGTRQWPGAQLTPGTPERTSPKSTPNHSSSAARSPRPGSSGKANRRSQEANRKIEGMGVREMDQVSFHLVEFHLYPKYSFDCFMQGSNKACVTIVSF